MDWRKTSQPFDELADKYDKWFNDNPLFAIELEALKSIREKLPAPKLEVGVGPGRFAEAMQVRFGIDPATAPLKITRYRNILGIQAVGEYLPIRPECIGTVFIICTLCFLNNPALALRECFKILIPGGRLVVGFIPQLSIWGQKILRKKDKNNPYYKNARLFTIADTVELIEQNGFTVIESWSTLMQHPNSALKLEKPVRRMNEDGGFCVLVAKKDLEQ